MKINGYLVVRKPMFCSRIIEGVGKVQISKSVGDLEYFGVDRLPWETIEDEFYANELSPYGKGLYSKIDQNTSHGLKVVKDYHLAEDILKYSNKNSEQNELIAVYSKELTSVVNSRDLHSNFNFLGYDVWYDGYGSMLNLGYFLKPELFENFVPLINQHGLFDEEEDARYYSQHYRKLSLQQEVEPMSGQLEYVSIWKISDD